jgi:glycosyltransferase involved in cell wall biosynthesis
MTILGLYLLNHIRTGGNKKYLELLEGLAARGNRVLVLFNDGLDYQPLSFTKLDIPVRYSGKFPPASYRFKQYLKKNIESLKKTISEQYAVHGIDIILNFGDTQLNAALYLKRQFKTTLLYGIRCNDVERSHILRSYGHLGAKGYFFSVLYESIERSREKKAAKYADCITFLNRSDMRAFAGRTGCPETKTEVIPNHIGKNCVEEYRDKNTSTELKSIVYVGVISADKGLWDLLKAAAILKTRGYKNPRYYLLGRLENTAPTVKLINDLDIQDIVSLEGFQNPFPYFAGHDLFIYPTLYDAFGNVLTEALHAGCPVIASRAPGPSEILQYPELLFSLGNPSEIADRIETCIMDNGFYQKIRNLCRERVSQFCFDWTGRYESLLKTHSTGQSA